VFGTWKQPVSSRRHSKSSINPSVRGSRQPSTTSTNEATHAHEVAAWPENWRYRIGDYRVLADIQDDRLVIIAIG